MTFAEGEAARTIEMRREEKKEKQENIEIYKCVIINLKSARRVEALHRTLITIHIERVSERNSNNVANVCLDMNKSISY